ncbi:hypothetical protein [Pseudonocardia oroxyli]|uniref:hypothetical protein n=1 Tax=Pseudonocardia oroxyli TaxID=366584 RepID=UPI00115FA1AB|nr:hypothetical protein [Pseudonocardia oroxyli]
MTRLVMPELLAAMLTCGGPSHFDVRDHRRLHESLVALWSDLADDPAARDLLPLQEPVPDPEVRWRFRGVTAALWKLNADRVLLTESAPGGAHFKVDHDAAECAAAGHESLPSTTKEAVHRRAVDWSIAVETDLKKARHSV